ncbi:hypothetical protein BVX97_01485 [bacterium E08(2017)]|nr:hypothetical protein BVX97_01485 [bacterium E08(2017)]
MIEAATDSQIAHVPDAITKIKDAFDIFESQSELLQASYEDLKRNLAASNRDLNRKNRALSTKVEELNHMSSRLQCLLESLSDGVLVVNRDLRIERCNAAAKTMLNLEYSLIAGRKYSEVVNGLGNIKLLNAAVNMGISFLDEQRVYENEDGSKVHMIASITPIWGNDGEVLGAVEVLRDVTRLRRLEERINAQKRLAALGEMAASVAHEIRNPLGTIEGFARLLKRDLDGQPDHLALANKIVEGVQNLNYVITNLLTYARPMYLQYEIIDVAPFLEEILELLDDTAKRDGVEVCLKEIPKDLLVGADKRQLRQVLLNLCINGIQACPGDNQGGKVSFWAERRMDKVAFVVADNGCGISENDKPQIFDPFFTKKEGGTGLGLSLSHKIISAHGGDLTFSSEHGAGASFEVLLPCDAAVKEGY